MFTYSHHAKFHKLASSLRSNCARFSTSAKVTSGSSKVPILGALFLATALSDPVITAWENTKQDDNVSYWKMNSSQRDMQMQQQSADKGCRLRNASDSTLNEPPDYSRIVIVGGGMAGLHTALCLAERMENPSSQEAGPPSKDRTMKGNKINTEVIVLEAHEIGNGASGRAKGMVVPGFQVPLENLEQNAYDYQSDSQVSSIPVLLRSIQTTLGIHDTTPRYSKAIVRELYDATYKALERLRNIVERYEIDCGWVESGAVEASIHDDEEADGEGDEDDGFILTSQQVDRMMGRISENDGDRKLYKWGEYDPTCAGVDPFALTIGLANAVERWGVKIYENVKVSTLEKTNQIENSIHKGKYTLTTKEGHVIYCDHVVLCTGAESGLSKRLSNSFVPIYTWMAASEPLYDKCPLRTEAAKAVISELDTKGQTKISPQLSSRSNAAPMCGDDHFALNYWRNNNKNDGRLLFGSLCDTYIFPASFISWRLRNALTEVYPHLSNVKFDHIWGGKLAVALNAMPIIGRDTDYDNNFCKDVTTGGVWFNTGFSGHGIVPTALAGSIVANAILGIPDRLMVGGDNDEIQQHQQLWELFHTYFPPSSWNGYPYSRIGAGAIFVVYNLVDWLGKKGVPVPRLPEIW